MNALLCGVFFFCSVALVFRRLASKQAKSKCKCNITLTSNKNNNKKYIYY